MLEENIALLRRQIDEHAPLVRILAALKETFLYLDDHFTLYRVRYSRQYFAQLGAFGAGLRQLNMLLPFLELDGNCDFIDQACRERTTLDGVCFFIARTLDALRAPLEMAPVPSHLLNKTYSIFAAMLASIEGIDSFLKEEG